PTNLTTKFLSLDGYLRLRTDYDHQLDLGQEDDIFGAPTGFPAPLECWKARSVCDSADITSSNMRLRLEPTVNITESVRVKFQIDVLDNLVLGSTPQGMFVNGLPRNGWTPVSAFTRTQVAP